MVARGLVVLVVVCLVGDVEADDAPVPVVSSVQTPAPASVTTTATAPTEAPAVPVAPPPRSPPERDWHIGLNLRTDFGARFYRMDLGVRLGRLDLIAVVDPAGVVDGDYDLDGIARYSLNRAWSVFSGARVTIVPIGRDRQLSEKLLVGASGLMPSLGLSRWRLHAGAELAVHVLSHGGGLPTRWVCVDSPTCRKDHFVFGLFARFEHASAF